MSRKEEIISNSIREYKIAKASRNKKEILQTVNMMHNVYIMCAPFNVKGIEKLRQLILEADASLQA